MERFNSLDKEKYAGFIHAIERIGYGEFVTAFAPYLIGTHDWDRLSENATPELQLAINLLLLGKEVNYDQAEKILPTLLIVENGIATVRSKLISIPTLALVSLAGMWLFVQRPQRNPTIYIGHDTYGLMARLRPARGSTALDLCSGPGTQGIYMASRGAKVAAVECNVIAAEVARLNGRLNSCGDNFQMHIGDLFDALPDHYESFDTISANPPLLPFPPEHFYPFVGHGGHDGLAVTWRILNGLPRWLNKRGMAQLIGTCVSDGFIPCAMDTFREIAALNSLDLLLTITLHSPFTRGTATFEGLAYTAAFGEFANRHEEIRNSLESLITKVSGTHLCYFSLSARHGSGRVQLMDLSSSTSTSLWFC